MSASSTETGERTGSPRIRPLSTVTLVLAVGALSLLGLGAVIWNLVDTREPVPPVQLAP